MTEFDIGDEVYFIDDNLGIGKGSILRIYYGMNKYKEEYIINKYLIFEKVNMIESSEVYKNFEEAKENVLRIRREMQIQRELSDSLYA